jgi:hypothetical protein
MELQRHISMCTRHHARWKRMANFARDDLERRKYLERSIFWLEMQTALISLWAAEQKAVGSEARKMLTEAKSNMLVRLASYGREVAQEIEI